MRWRDRSMVVTLYRNHKARQRYAVEYPEPQEPAPLTIPIPATVAVVVSIRGYWRGSMRGDGRQWTRHRHLAAVFLTADLAERAATGTMLEHDSHYRVEMVDNPTV